MWLTFRPSLHLLMRLVLLAGLLSSLTIPCRSYDHHMRLLRANKVLELRTAVAHEEYRHTIKSRPSFAGRLSKNLKLPSQVHVRMTITSRLVLSHS